MKFRRVTMDDADFLLTLKNDPETRKFAIVTHEEIRKENHLAWLKNKLAQKDVTYFIITSHGQPAGTVRVEADKEISIHIAPEYRGKGLASTAISRIAGKVYAKIVEGNIASMNTFIKNGFKFTGYEKGVYLLKN